MHGCCRFMPRGLEANSCRYTEKLVKFPTSPRKSAVRYGAPALVVEGNRKKFCSTGFFRSLFSRAARNPRLVRALATQFLVRNCNSYKCLVLPI
jgi:hypothetical protein